MCILATIVILNDRLWHIVSTMVYTSSVESTNERKFQPLAIMSNTYFQKQADGRWFGYVNNKIVVRSPHLAYAQMKVLQAGGTIDSSAMDAENVGELTVTGPREVAKSEFSVAERFKFIEEYVEMVARNDLSPDEEMYSFILCGSGGLGKTTTVLNTLHRLGLIEDSPEEAGDFRSVRGYSTARGLYRLLYETNGQVLVIDDADSCFKDATAASILKAALDDKEKRIISWNAESRDDEIPNRFTYTGRVIFISNLSIAEFPQALISRSQKVDVTLTMDEKIDRIISIFNEDPTDKELKAEVIEFIQEHKKRATDLNIRTATNLLRLRKAKGPDWARLALYSFIA